MNNTYLRNLGIELNLNNDLQELIRIATPDELLSFFVVNRAFMDATSPNIEYHWQRDAKRFIKSDDCEAFANDFSPRPKAFVRKIRSLIDLKISAAGSKIMNLT